MKNSNALLKVAGVTIVALVGSYLATATYYRKARIPVTTLTGSDIQLILDRSKRNRT